MEKGKPRHALKKRDDLGTGIKPILPHAPRLQRGAGNVEPIGGLTLGEPSGWQVAILLKECSASASLPSLVTITMALLPPQEPLPAPLARYWRAPFQGVT